MLNSYPGTCQKTNPGQARVAQEKKLTMAAEVPALALAAVVTQIFVRRFSAQNAGQLEVEGVRRPQATGTGARFVC